MPKGVLDDAIEPDPPARMEFSCPCGEVLVATPQTYDKRATCSRCGVILLVNLVYSSTKRSFHIIPIRVK